MDGNKVLAMRTRIGRTTLQKWVLFTFAFVASGALASVEASPIRSRSLFETGVRASSIKSNLTWQEFLNGGVAEWSTTPPPSFPSGIRLATVNGRLVETPFVKYLLWRRSLDPIRFDAHHPNISGPLAQILQPPATPVTPPTSTPPQGQVVVPEPSTILIALLMSSVGIAYVERTRRRGQTAGFGGSR